MKHQSSLSQDKIPLYTASQARELDRLAIEQENISGFILMSKAAETTFQQLIFRWPDAKKIDIFCGIGNNGGDGYLIAKIAHQLGFDVKVYQLGNLEKQKGDALSARKSLEATGITLTHYQQDTLFDGDIIVDAMLGTGLERHLDGLWLSAVQSINVSTAKVISVDVPSGLHSDTGAQLAESVVADLTVTYIARKQGLFTGDGKTCAGEVAFDSLSIPDYLYEQTISEVDLLPKTRPLSIFKRRNQNSHKGQHGHVLIVGGAPGMNGAVIMAARAALRCGCGLVSVATHPSHASTINIQQPEIMSHGVQSGEELNDLVDAADVIILGPGLGESSWAKSLFDFVIQAETPVIIDADGLNLLAKVFNESGQTEKNIDQYKKSEWILTPHPGEAAKLLLCTTQDVQQDRFGAIKQLQKKYSSICVLKGAGSLIYQGDKIQICSSGNPGMASAGMGDVLSGIIGSLVAQGVYQSKDLFEVVSYAVCLHSAAGDAEAEAHGEKGLLATDLLPHLRSIVNA